MRILGLLAIAFPVLAGGATQSIEFNRDIRPIFSDKCFSCHGPDPGNRKTKMRLDREDGAKLALSGGRVAILAGDPEHSEVFKRIVSENASVRMPPAYAGKDRLTSQEIETIRQWIGQGAPWQALWSFIPPTRPSLPPNGSHKWGGNPIDAFVASRLSREGLTPSPEAERPTLIRRVSLDVTGLPPTPAEVNAFVRDSSPNAYERVVDRLLASHSYAERMAFRWMEAARYADTNGYQTDGKRDMWRWRDWVIDAFDRNMPFDQFTIEQIGGDLLPHPTLNQQIATAFNRNNRTSAEGGIVPEEFRVSYVADRAETTSTVWLGLTLGCARCHDHKYDPITQKDFYSFFAYFNNLPEKGLVYNWGNDDPLIQAPTVPQQAALSEWDQRVLVAKSRLDRLNPLIAKAQRKWEKRLAKAQPVDWTITNDLVYRQPDGTKMFGVGTGDVPVEVDGEVANFEYTDPFTFAAEIKPESANGAILTHADNFAEGQGHGLYVVNSKLRLHVIFRWTDIGMRVETAEPLQLHEWQRVLVTYDGSHKASGVRMYVNGQAREVKILFDELNWPMKFKAPLRIGAGSGLRFEGSIRDVRIYKAQLSPEQVATLMLTDSITAIAAKPRLQRTEAQANKLRFCFLETAAPRKVSTAIAELASVQKDRAKFEETIPTLMVMREGPRRAAHMLKRGAYDAPGEEVQAAVPSFLPPMQTGWPMNRLGLARWLVDRSNPLTARVTVNRYWQMYFGTGLVKTVDDFGSQGELPVYQDLLDWLAVEFMESGWNVKSIQKTILLSATYRQSARGDDNLVRRDPENRLLARGPRLRLGPEMIRDQTLAVSGLLVDKVGGPSVKPYQPPNLWQELAGGSGYIPDRGEGLYRRSLYTYWKRTVAPPFMVNFDSPNRETCTVRESRTNTPLQALNLMNEDIFLEAARKLAERVLHDGGDTPESRVDYAYKLALARSPSDSERRIMLSTLQRFERRYRSDQLSAIRFIGYGDSSRDLRIPAPQLAAYMAVTSILFNLDETITKP